MTERSSKALLFSDVKGFSKMSEKECLIFCKTENKRFFLTHGHLWNANNLPPIPAGTVLCHGHTHLPVLETFDNGITVFNPGSISLPKGGNPQTFGFFDGENLSIRLVEDGSIF